jgi:cytochrome c peroxidase
MQLFYGKVQCASCHSGVFQTDQQFHSICMPQIGPGKGDGPDGHDDFGREQVTGNPADRYTFRTPTLRNVALTGPWGHDGAYDSLMLVTLHHLFPRIALEFYTKGQAVLPEDPALDVQDFLVHDDRARRAAIGASSEAPRVPINLGEFMQILEFLQALTDPASLDLRSDVPPRVPSGLPMYD